MSRLKPCTKSRTGAAGSPAARTAISVPSNDATGAEVVGRQVPQRRLEVVLGSRRSEGPSDGARRDGARRDPGGDHRRALPGHGRPPGCTPRHPGADPRPRSRSRSCLRGRASSHAVTLVALRAEQHDLVARLEAHVAAIDDQLVHRHAPRDPAPLPADQDVGARRQDARVAVGVAHRHGGDPRVARPARSDGHTNPLARPASRFAAHRRAPRSAGRKTEVVADAGRGLHPVEADADPDQIEPGLRVEDRAGRVGRVEHPRLMPGRRTSSTAAGNASSCASVVTSSSRPSAKCVHSASSSRPEPDHALDEAASVVGRPDADPVHPRVDLHVHADRPSPSAPRGSGRAPASEYTVGVRRAATAAASDPGGELGQHQDRRLDPGGAEPRPSSTRATPSHDAPPRAPRVRPATSPCP